LPLSQRNRNHIDFHLFKNLIKILSEAGFESISLTGGEPTLHPQIIRIIDLIGQHRFKTVFFHTNGISLNNTIINRVAKKFTKIAVSIHSANYLTWHRMTGGSKEQFRKIFLNLKKLSNLKGGPIVELKMVPIKGYNGTKKEFFDFLELCNKSKFKFKILNFEPIAKRQLKLAIPFRNIKEILTRVGCKTVPREKTFRGQSNYLPLNKFKYKNTTGVAIEIGCGDEKVCKGCYLCNEIFISSDLKIKPCHMSNHQINIADFARNKENRLIIKKIIESRLFLSKAPGIGLEVWQNSKTQL